MSRLFDGVDDRLLFSTGGNNITAPNTCVAILRKNSDGTFDGIYGHGTAENSPTFDFILDTSDFLNYDRDNSADFNTSLFTVKTAEGWVLVGVSKASGTAVSRFHKYVYGTNAWTHSDSAGTCANPALPGAGGVAFLGEHQTGVAPFDGDMEVVANWNRVLTDAEVENLPFSLQHWYASGPVALWLLDQSLTTQTIADLMGSGANQTAITGTAIATNHPKVFNRGFPVLAVTRTAAVTAARFRRPAFLRTGSRGAYGGS